MIVGGDDGLEMTVEVTTGRLVELKGPEGKSRFRFERGALDGLLREIDEQSRGFANLFDARHSWASWGMLPFEALATLAKDRCDEKGLTAQQARGLAALRKRVWESLVAWDESMTRWLAEKLASEREFGIPCDPQTIAAWAANPQAIWTAYALPCCDALLPRQSWIWTLCREAVLGSSGRGNYTLLELVNLAESADIGPAGLFFLARVCEEAGIESFSQLYAKRGLELLTEAGFRKDLACLLSADALRANGNQVGKLICHLATAARGLSDDEMAALELFLSADGAKQLEAFVADLRRTGDRPMEDVLLPALVACWGHGIKERVESALRQLVKPEEEGGGR